MIRRARVLVPFLAIGGLTNPADAAEAAWAVADAPYRAVVRLRSPPPAPINEAGVAIELPEFGHTMAGLLDMVLTDAAGRMVPLSPVWRMEGQRAIVVARDMKPKAEYFLYFGGNKLRRGLGGWMPKISLLMETRRLPANGKFDTWSEMENTWRRATEVDGGGLVGAVYHGQNPFGDSQNFCSHYSGYLITDGAKQIYLYTQSSDASFVLVNGKSAFEWPGVHRANANARTVIGKMVDCSPDGLTKIDYYHAKGGEGAPAANLGWQRGRGARLQPIPADGYLHPAGTVVDRIEDAQKRPVPIPRVEFASYLGFGGLWLFEAACSVDRANTEGWRITWQFEDGGTFTGPSVPRALVGGAPMKVRVQMQRGSETVAGLHRISFAEVPRQASVNETSDVNRYLALLAKETPAQLSARTLRAAIIFLGEYGSEQEAGRFADAYLKRPADANDPVWAQAQIAHLRVLSQTDPQQALKELRRLDPNVRKRHSQQFDFFEMDLLVFYLRDDSAVQRAQQIVLENPNAEVGRIARVRVGDLYRLQGRTKEAIEHYHGLQRALGEETAGRKLPAQDRAFSMAVADMLAHGFRQEVEGKLREWESAHPLAKVESDFLLMRARFLMTLGRWREALTEIESFEKMQPDSPYQIDLDFHRARALHELGQKEQARKIWAEIARKYPKHALADESKSWANKR